MIRAYMAVLAVLGMLAVMQPYLGILGLAENCGHYEQGYLLPVLTGSILLGLASLRRRAAMVMSAAGLLIVAVGLLIPWLMSGESQGPQMSAGFVMVCFVVPIGITIQFAGGLWSISSPKRCKAKNGCQGEEKVSGWNGMKPS